jgi:hypothetical protein
MRELLPSAKTLVAMCNSSDILTKTFLSRIQTAAPKGALSSRSLNSP